MTRFSQIKRLLAPAMLLVAVMAFGEDATKTPAKVTRSASSLTNRTQAEVENIANLIEALKAYAGRFGGKFPAKIDDLVQKNVLSQDDFKRFTTSPLDVTGGLQGNGYLYYFEGKDPSGGGTDVLIVGKNPLAPADSRRAVGLEDGSVTWWRRQQVDTFLKAESKKEKAAKKN